jgi:hypothetical protein
VAELVGQKRVIIFGGAAKKKKSYQKNDGLCEWLSLQGC